MPIKTKYQNYKTRKGKISKGCKQCVKGEKLVLFVTGICGNGCKYCPVSDNKNDNDEVFANEWNIKTDEELLKEAEMMNAKGVGITGGDPLARIDRTTKYIKLLKKKYGKKFHTHLYTPLLRVNKENLKKLYESGLDEIRFHPKLHEKKEWNKILQAKEYDWDIGIEVPTLPEYEKELKYLLEFLSKEIKPDFINLNEFEYADNKVFEKNDKRYKPKNLLSYGVKGSEELSIELLKLSEKLGLSVHYCTAKSKDSVQLAKRIKRRAKKAAKEFDEVDGEGILTRFAIYPELNITEIKYNEKLDKLKKATKQKIIQKLQKLEKIILSWGVPKELVAIDEERLRILTNEPVATELIKLAKKNLTKDLNTTIAKVTEYPTHDCFIVEADIMQKRK